MLQLIFGDNGKQLGLLVKGILDVGNKLFAIFTKDELEHLVWYGGEGGALC